MLRLAENGVSALAKLFPFEFDFLRMHLDEFMQFHKLQAAKPRWYLSC
jgi:hypothetical protein